jgi:hypothetical protein
VYDPSRFEPSPPDQKEDMKRLEQENGILQDKLLCLEEDYRGLQEKRLQDVSVAGVLLKINLYDLQTACVWGVSTVSLCTPNKVPTVCRENVCRV